MGCEKHEQDGWHRTVREWTVAWRFSPYQNLRESLHASSRYGLPVVSSPNFSDVSLIGQISFAQRPGSHWPGKATGAASFDEAHS